MTRDEFAAVYAALPLNQRIAFEQLTMDDSDGIGARTYEALERRGLVEGFDATLPGRFPVTIRRYRMPVHVHMAWCAYCAEQPDGAA